jgi:RNA recognition motif-containing protein
MSFTVFLGNLPTWVTADDIRGWLSAENLVADAIKVIRNPETQESKGFAFIDAPNTEEMNAIIRRFDRAPLEDRLLRANPAQPPRPKGQGQAPGRPQGPPVHASGFGGPRRESPSSASAGDSSGAPSAHNAGSVHNAGSAHNIGSAHGVVSGAPAGAGQANAAGEARAPRRRKGSAKRPNGGGAQTAFAEELAKAL